uniref:Uncharacterized protein n=1 Tax=Anguilla anguilla TaxID=7936 RepID=A0A0E9THP1_ANGAN
MKYLKSLVFLKVEMDSVHRIVCVLLMVPSRSLGIISARQGVGTENKKYYKKIIMLDNIPGHCVRYTNTHTMLCCTLA